MDGGTQRLKKKRTDLTRLPPPYKPLDSLNLSIFNQMWLNTFSPECPNQQKCALTKTEQQKPEGGGTDSPVHQPPSSVLSGTILPRFPRTTAHTRRSPSLLLSLSRPSEGAPVQWTGLNKKKQEKTTWLKKHLQQSPFLSSISLRSDKDCKINSGWLKDQKY